MPTKTPRFADKLKAELTHTAPIHPPLDEAPGAIGRTMFDTSASDDLSVTVLLAEDRVQSLPSQALVRILSKDGRRYLGVVGAGPFAEPDSLRADSPVLLAVAIRGAEYMPRYHGRVLVKLLAEETADGEQILPRLRPLPHSPVHPLETADAAKLLNAGGDVRLGKVVGQDIVVGVPSTSKAVLPRHTAILGTTGSGKSTTVASLVANAVRAGMAVVLLDVEGEYTRLHEPAIDPKMLAVLKDRGIPAEGVPAEAMGVYHLVGRETTCPTHPNVRPFSLQFARLSPYTVCEMLGMSEAQSDRFLYAYDVAKCVLREVGVFPQGGVSAEEKLRQERMVTSLDEFERGYPRLRLSHMLDIVGRCKALVNKGTLEPWCDDLKSDAGLEALAKYIDIKQMPGNAASWGKLHSLLWKLQKLRVFDRDSKSILRYADMLRPGHLSVIDLSDSGLSELNNLAVADVLRGLQDQQAKRCRDHEAGGEAPARVLIVIEEAHEFLNAERVADTPHLFRQVERIAKRGRKRWLGLAFVTQSPAHLPRQVLGLCNNFILHKLNDPFVVGGLKERVSGGDDGLWARLPGLAPGQAIVAMAHLARPILTAMDPAGGRLRLVE